MTVAIVVIAVLLVSGWILSSLAVSIAMWKSAGRIERVQKNGR